MSLESELRSPYGNAEAANRAINVDLAAAMKEDRGSPEKDREKYWPKDLMPNVLTKRDEWKRWGEDVEDFMGNIKPGLKLTARTVAEPVDEKQTKSGSQTWRSKDGEAIQTCNKS